MDFICARSLGQLCVADPLGRDEDDDVEDGGAHREHAPQDGRTESGAQHRREVVQVADAQHASTRGATD